MTQAQLDQRYHIDTFEHRPEGYVRTAAEEQHRLGIEENINNELLGISKFLSQLEDGEMQTETSNPEPPKSVYSGKKLNFIKDKTEVQRKRGFESSIKNACRNFLCMPNFKGLSTRKEFTEYHVIYFAYFLGTVLSPRNFIRNVYSPTQQQLIHTLWRVYVPEFFKDFCTNINNAIILGDENKNAQSLKIIRVFVTNLNSEQKTILKCKFQDNASKIQMIYSKCFQTHYYNTNTCGLNTK